MIKSIFNCCLRLFTWLLLLMFPHLGLVSMVFHAPMIFQAFSQIDFFFPVKIRTLLRTQLTLMRIDMHLDVDQYASYSNTLQLKIRKCQIASKSHLHLFVSCQKYMSTFSRQNMITNRLCKTVNTITEIQEYT